MKNNKEKVLSFLGLATRAGKIVSGDDSTLLDLKKGKVNLILIAEDASNNTKKLFKDKSTFRNIPYLFFSTKDEIGFAIGKSPRAVVGIKDENFSKKIIELIEI
ncbi:L7Ae/L30e/S12e/Gadd45 family ribosomal protein [Clostridioides difficile]|uniref:L7Ae/L30e/S12e/Gadd45 family ribosomal protein n=1 Tax=Clostridioides difficile TaxID=1496 RepID=UPI000B16D8BD|nr:ribosomal L7Ae/L30e/S12e/Gadd45 family protein [Clostridioides difficile]AXU75013.1 ribosomal protein [Clostridioides difficile]MDK3178769.1 ribosomal L7Ae/L30e/S12e/Gadd45 family protein [Clostridioides difficile]MDW0090196.1 ribosomal L7Ae/L30e/S12e/Gadd45 family protein [Clostridioides difficile]VHY34848.1 ribosomal protein L7Ae/L30e/S12e/Gadd45 [Clostridioides difficile]HBF0841946.1 ribosomal L7Ae/L30e/S12e/Gadd45 family protein [Clostridioides difficile]